MKYLGEVMTIAIVLSYDRNQHCLTFVTQVIHRQ